jgi:cysteinyl-tRNA synthetase
VRMYVCGMTVYDYIHVGHARMLVAFDVVLRYLRERGYQVTYVRNITDIDDKIIQRAVQNGESIQALTERFIAANAEDFAALGLLPADHEPRATRSIPGMIRMISELIARGHAYAAANGDVYYDVSSFDGYGRLSGKDPADLRSGARVEIGEAKADPLDFVLWKAAKPGEPSWDSPWGLGRPGWHIECSVMSTELLGEHFDLHGGGLDLQFPHHENEIAQTCGATGSAFVKYWMHNGFVQVNEEKMSKSLGNFFTLRTVLARYAGEVVRFMIINSHYRSPLNYSDAQLDQARAGLERLYLALRSATPTLDPADLAGPEATRFHAAMQDDFNTPMAVAVLFEVASGINKAADAAQRDRQAGLLRHLGGVLGLVQADPVAFLKGGPATAGGLSDADIDALVAARVAARQAKDFKESDRIRDLLKDAGIQLEDTAGKTSWRRG